MHHSSGQHAIGVHFVTVSARALVVPAAVAADTHTDPRRAPSVMGLVPRSAYVPDRAGAEAYGLHDADYRELRGHFRACGAGASDMLPRLRKGGSEAVSSR